MNKIKLTINGNAIELDEGSTVAGFIEERKVTGKMFAVEINLEIINKDQYETTVLKNGDVIEIVGFFGGG